VYGGLRFFERAEIKDTLAFLRLLANPHDDPSFERGVNMPPRGIGPRTLDAVRGRARDLGCSLWQAGNDLVEQAALPARATNALRGFLELIGELRATTAGEDLWDIVAQVIETSGLREHFRKNKDGKGIDRVENLEELVNATRQFSYATEDEELDDLSAFLAHAALEAGEAQADAQDDCVQLMTLHSAKGLEFPLVFITGVEEGLFPHSMSADDPDRLEEERRLCYVGMTRAMRQLVISFAETRRLYGSETYPMPSRFIREIPSEHMVEIRARPRVSRAVYNNLDPEPAGGFRLGQRVVHPKFGEGVVLNAEGGGAGARVQVNFEAAGSKWLVIAYANLQPV
jgi:DNA helicase-2/ATP-dependent DNA helicase PcrA